jgi:signal transduction histidine kinase
LRARSQLVALLCRLLEARERTVAAQEVARWLGAEDLVVFVRDPDLGVLLPAPGFKRTLRPGPSWRAFLAGCTVTPRLSGELAGPDGATRPVVGYQAADGSVLVLVGGPPDEESSTDLVELFPMLSCAMQVEGAARMDSASAKLEIRAAELARALAVELDSARREVEDSRTHLVAANRAKDQFLAMLGHELRNPLAPIVTALALMRQRNEWVFKKERTIIERQARHMVRMIDDLLDVSRISRGKVQLQRHPIEIRQVLLGAIETAGPIIEQNQHTLVVDVAERGLVVLGDEYRLTQIVTNLLTNAAKYSERAKTIQVAATQTGDEVVLRVVDQGHGIPSDLLPRIFDTFVQGERTIDRALGGLGLGLSIVRGLTEAHGGTVQASSAGPGHGSQFILKLPAADLADPGI